MSSTRSMRERTTCAPARSRQAGALQLTNPGTDGTPLRAPASCAWFESPEELRGLAEHYLAHPDEAAMIAAGGQQLTRDDTYVERGRTLARWIAELV